MKTVAVIGAGPAGLVAAKYLKSEGFHPVVFEQGGSVGGQWSGDARYSGVWPGMHTNTSREMTAFSDLRHEPDTPVYPANQTMHAYLERYAERFDLLSCVQLHTRVLHLDRDPAGAGWLLRFARLGQSADEQRFDYVVVASGRYHKPMIPAIAGLQSFTGAGGATHAFHYKGPVHYRGQRVLVAGCSISALEIASDLAMQGAARVIAAYRRQRYVHQKIIAGTPADQLFINRYQTLAQQAFPPEVCARSLKELIIRTGGSPEQFGARQPAASLNEAGATMSQTFLPLVAEGRIGVRPWIEAVDGKVVRFSDGSEEQVDAIIFGTGYELSLPYLSDGLRRTLGVDASHIDLYQHTLHPDLPGLAFVGMMDLVGTIFPALELQARWLAYVLSGARPTPSLVHMRAGIAACQKMRAYPPSVAGNHAMLLFAREAGVDPQLHDWPDLARALLYGPMSAMTFRLSGRDSLPHAAQLVTEDARAYGVVASTDFTEEERAQLQGLARVHRDKAFTRFVERMASARAPGEEQPCHGSSTTAIDSVSPVIADHVRAGLERRPLAASHSD